MPFGRCVLRRWDDERTIHLAYNTPSGISRHRYRTQRFPFGVSAADNRRLLGCLSRQTTSTSEHCHRGDPSTHSLPANLQNTGAYRPDGSSFVTTVAQQQTTHLPQRIRYALHPENTTTPPTLSILARLRSSLRGHLTFLSAVPSAFAVMKLPFSLKDVFPIPVLYSPTLMVTCNILPVFHPFSHLSFT